MTCLKLSCACTLQIAGMLPADAVCCNVLQQITVLSLCCITETAKIAGTSLLLSDTCLHRKMLGYKLRAFLEMLLYKIGKICCHISERECSCMRFWAFFPSVTVALILVFSQNLFSFCMDIQIRISCS